MPVQITIRNVPDEIRNELASRAARVRLSMQEYLLGELERVASRPTVETWLDQVRQRKSASAIELSAKRVLEHRDADRR